MKLNASLLLIGVFGTSSGAAALTLQDAGMSYPQPAPVGRDGPIAAPPMASAASTTAPRATSGEGESRYDAVGLAGGISGDSGTDARPIAAHGTLPIGSFVEVTALDSGRTVILEIRGDNTDGNGDRLIGLSDGAARQLGLAAGAAGAVRVRQVKPTAQDLALLRAGASAPSRLNAPEVLLAALRKRLPAVAGPIVVTSEPKPVAAIAPSPAASSARTGRYRVQVAAFSTEVRARTLADRLSGIVVPAGRLYRVQLGPFESNAEAKRARDAVAVQGYGDAQILTTH